MKNQVRIWGWIGCLLISQSLFAQTEKFQVSGYLKNLQTWSWSKESNLLLNDGFLHQRLNVKWMPDSSWLIQTSLRNRLFYGETLKSFPEYADLLDQDKGLWDGFFVPAKSKSLILSTQIDRLFLQWQRGRWEIKAGRQRVNWGITTTWNPNDLFNAYNFLDFDYEERPGSDALRIRFRTDSLSSLELAISPGRAKNRHIQALRYQTNLRGYDLQMVAGKYHDQWTIGLGWAGNLGQAGFKGEGAIFKSTVIDSSATLSFTAQVDHVFKGEWMVSAGLLYAGAATNGDFRPETFASNILEPNRLMPVQWSAIATVAKPITPIFSGSLTTVWSPHRELLLIMPTLAYNIRENWDLDLTGQLFFWTPPGKPFNLYFGTVYLRLRWSF